MYLITGGTGSFGQTMLNKLIARDERVRVFSRDEAKQDALRRSVTSADVEWVIGDTRDAEAVRRAFKGVRYAFHAAALKQVPSCELNPMEAVKTNIIGSENVIQAAINANIEALVVLSTDKAVYPINAMGISKAMMERLAIASARQSSTRIMVTRYGNVMMSRGSVIPLFRQQIYKDGRITLTSPEMTRFMMSLEESVELVLHAWKHGQSGDLLVKQSPSATMKQVALAVMQLCESAQVDVIGARHGEKMHESLLTAEEFSRAENINDNFFRVPADNRSLNYQNEHGGRLLEHGYTSKDQTIELEQLVELIRPLV